MVDLESLGLFFFRSIFPPVAFRNQKCGGGHLLFPPPPLFFSLSLTLLSQQSPGVIASREMVFHYTHKIKYWFVCALLLFF